MIQNLRSSIEVITPQEGPQYVIKNIVRLFKCSSYVMQFKLSQPPRGDLWVTLAGLCKATSSSTNSKHCQNWSLGCYNIMHFEIKCILVLLYFLITSCYCSSTFQNYFWRLYPNGGRPIKTDIYIV